MNETSKKQIPITVEDIKKVPDIINNPDDVMKGNDTLAADRETIIPSIRYIKTDTQGRMYVIEAVPSKGDLQIKTMWKEPAELIHNTSVLHHTPKAANSNLSTINDSITSKESTINTAYAQNSKNDIGKVNDLPTQESVENVQEMGYNKYLRKTDKVAKYEYNQVQSEVMTWHSKEADGVHLIDLSKNGYKSYIYNKNGDSIEIIKRIDADEDTINTIRKEIENGTYNEPKALNQYLENVKNEIRRNRASSSQLPNRVRNDTNVGENNRNARTEERNNRTRIDENNSRNLKDSNKSSFSMSKDNKGRTLSKEQQEYFKGSKVRDENGNLLEVYHGTNAGFDVFDKKKQVLILHIAKVDFFLQVKILKQKVMANM